jgi:anti-sigma regulatory factor (Ser/Thr protein kinase)
MDKTFTSYVIAERSYVSYIKREIHSHVTRSNFSEKQIAEIDIIVSEVTSNMIKHAGGGELLYRFLDDNFEIISIDNGPGIADPARMMKDGVSTTKTLGHGLGAIKRLSSLSQIYSIPGWGTILYSLIKKHAEPLEKKSHLDVKAVFINKPREEVCGDGYWIKHTAAATIVFFGDGLGHGPYAKEAVDTAGEFFFDNNDTDPVEILRQMHEKIRRTRGLVGTVAVCNKVSGEWRICGIGNILTRLYSGLQYKNFMPYNGVVGLNIPKSMSPSVAPSEKNQHLIMCSDGIQTRWDLNKYPAIFKYDNTVLAAAIYKDFTRGNDDSSVLIAKVF